MLLKRDRVEKPWLSHETPLSEAVLHRAMKDAVHQVFVDGRKLVDEGRVMTIDRDAVMHEIKARLDQPESHEETQDRQMVGRLMPYLEQIHRDHPL